MWFEWKVALRFLSYGRMQTALIIIAIAVGTSVQLFLSILISGLQTDLIQKTVGSVPHITAESQQTGFAAPDLSGAGDFRAAYPVNSDQRQLPIYNWQEIMDQVRGMPEVSEVSAVINGSGYINYGEKALPVSIKGIEPGEADGIYQLRRKIVQGQALLSGNQILIGLDLAKDLNRQLGDTVQLTTSSGTSDLFTISGIFDFQSQVLNKGWVFSSRNRAESLYSLNGGVSEIDIKVKDVFAAADVSRSLASRFPALNWLSWQENNASLLSALQSQSSSSSVIQFFVLVAVTLGIASVLAVSAVQKSRQIGIMKALGALTGSVSRIFLIQGALLGLIGAVFGSVLGIGILKAFSYLTSRSSGQQLFLLELKPATFATAILIAMVAGTLAAYFPARRSASLNPIEVIRNG